MAEKTRENKLRDKFGRWSRETTIISREGK